MTTPGRGFRFTDLNADVKAASTFSEISPLFRTPQQLMDEIRRKGIQFEEDDADTDNRNDDFLNALATDSLDAFDSLPPEIPDTLWNPPPKPEDLLASDRELNDDVYQYEPTELSKSEESIAHSNEQTAKADTMPIGALDDQAIDDALSEFLNFDETQQPKTPKAAMLPDLGSLPSHEELNSIEDELEELTTQKKQNENKFSDKTSDMQYDEQEDDNQPQEYKDSDNFDLSDIGISLPKELEDADFEQPIQELSEKGVDLDSLKADKSMNAEKKELSVEDELKNIGLDDPFSIINEALDDEGFNKPAAADSSKSTFIIRIKKILLSALEFVIKKLKLREYWWIYVDVIAILLIVIAAAMFVAWYLYY